MIRFYWCFCTILIDRHTTAAAAEKSKGRRDDQLLRVFIQLAESRPPGRFTSRCIASAALAFAGVDIDQRRHGRRGTLPAGSLYNRC